MRTRRRQPGRFTWGLVAAAVLSGCTDGSPAEPTSTLSPQAALYLDAAVRIMESFSIKKNEIDWAEFRATTFEQAEAVSAQTTEDTYPMIVDALERIGDNHSFFQPASTPQQLVGQFGQALRDGPNTADPMSELIEGSASARSMRALSTLPAQSATPQPMATPSRAKSRPTRSIQLSTSFLRSFLPVRQ